MNCCRPPHHIVGIQFELLFSSTSMATETNSNNKKRKQRYLPQNKPVKKGAYGLHPGVQGFFITCDGGWERQAAREAINVIDSFYEEVVHGADSNKPQAEISKQSFNKKTKFVYSDSSDEEERDEENETEDNVHESTDRKDNPTDTVTDANLIILANEKLGPHGPQKESNFSLREEVEASEHPAKKQCTETVSVKFPKFASPKMDNKSVDELIETELAELGDKNKRRFCHLDSGCNGVVFVQMRKRDSDPNPKDIVQYMMTSLASTRKHVSRFMLRVLPVELTCYASEEEISRVIKPLIAQYFPVETQNPLKYAVLYEARANTGIDRSKIINAVAKSVTAPHKVDLGNPDMNIVVQIVKTVCCIGIVEKYKEFSKYNLRQLTSPQAQT